MNFKNFNKAHKQRGAILVVTLIILLIVTVLGLASMRSSNMELKMAISARDRAVAFEAAESALTAVERILTASPYPLTSFLPNCDVATGLCFTSDCSNGQCFTGDFSGATYKDDCRLANPTDNSAKQPWRVKANWANNNKHKTVEVLTNSGDGNQLNPVDVSYMLEFLCFVPRDENAVDDTVNSRNNGVPLYRVTVRATGETNRAVVMLQSTFRSAE